MPHAHETRLLRLFMGLFALTALTFVLATAWLRFFVPNRHGRQGARVRDLVSWMPPQGR